MSDDEWVKDAMTDEAVVAHMLLRLHKAQPPPLPPTAPARPALHLGWTVRQRRSRSAPRHGDGKKKAEAARASPTTPLSWSGGTSVSGGVLDGFEESSRPAKPTDGSRSKVTVTCQTTMTTTTITKRARKKKSLAELREEESLLLKEKRKLKNELSTLRLTLEKQRSANESLKRIKVTLPVLSIPWSIHLFFPLFFIYFFCYVNLFIKFRVLVLNHAAGEQLNRFTNRINVCGYTNNLVGP